MAIAIAAVRIAASLVRNTLGPGAGNHGIQVATLRRPPTMAARGVIYPIKTKVPLATISRASARIARLGVCQSDR